MEQALEGHDQQAIRCDSGRSCVRCKDMRKNIAKSNKDPAHTHTQYRQGKNASVYSLAYPVKPETPEVLTYKGTERGGKRNDRDIDHIVHLRDNTVCSNKGWAKEVH